MVRTTSFFVRTLCGRTHVISDWPELSRPDDLVRYIQKHIEHIEDASELEICVRTSSGKRVRGNKVLCLTETFLGGSTTLHCSLPLLGGKGGFGSTLRAGGKKHKYDDNVDACRDLQGRRIRQRTAEEKVKQWNQRAGERELEQVALDYMKKTVQETRKKDIEKVLEEGVDDGRELKKKLLKEVRGAVSAGLAHAHAPTSLDSKGRVAINGGGSSRSSSMVGTKKDKLAAFDEESSEESD